MTLLGGGRGHDRLYGGEGNDHLEGNDPVTIFILAVGRTLDTEAMEMIQ